MLTLTLAASVTSCSDFLEAENKSNPQDAQEYFAKNPEQLLYTANDRLKTLVNRIDIFVKGTDLYMKERGGNGGDFNVYNTLSAENSDVLSFWKAAYDLINNANGVIQLSEDKTTKTCQEAMFLRAYAYYLLAQHFGSVPYVTTYTLDASRNYPRTPLDEVYANITADLQTLVGSSSKLSATDHTGHPSKAAANALLAKVTLAAAWDLDVTLNDAAAGTYTVNSTTRFAEAAQYAEAAISGITLDMSFANKWSPSNEGNKEEIFSVQYDKDSWAGDQATSGHSFQNNFGNYYRSSVGYKYVGSENGQSMKSAYLYEEGDTRYEGTFMTTMYNYNSSWGTEGYYAYYNCTEAELANLGIANRFFPYWVSQEDATAELTAHKSQFKQGTYKNTPEAIILSDPAVIFKFDGNGNISSTSTRPLEDLHLDGGAMGDVCVKKWDDANSDQLDKNNDYRDIVLLHASDLYLIAAEAYYMAGNTSAANTKLNAVRTRAGVESVDLANPASYRANHVNYSVNASFGTFTGLDMILDERGRELYAEGNRWEDLKRTKQLVRYNIAFNREISSISDISSTSGEIKWLRPIPADEISANEGLTTADQNPGY